MSQELDDLRARIKQNQDLIDREPRGTEARERLQAEINHDTERLLRGERQREEAREAARRQDTKAGMVIMALAFTAAGVGITYAGWGTWWLLLGIPATLLGVTGLFSEFSEN